MGFAGRKQGGLLSRVRRLLSPRNRASGFSEGFLSAMVLVFCLGITTVNAYTPYNFRNFTAFANKSWEKVQDVASLLMSNVLPTSTQSKKEDSQAKAGKTAENAEAREFLPTFKPLKRVELKDTIRFGNGFMAITDKKGNVTVFKEGKEIPKADFEKYKSEFSVVETPKKDSKAYIYYPDNIDIPDVPAIPAMPSMPAMPAMPPMPNVLAPLGSLYGLPEAYEDVIVIENGKKVKRKIRKQMRVRDSKAPRTIIINPNGYEQSWENWGKQMERWGEQWGKQWEGQWEGQKGKEWEEKWEKWGKEMEKWGEKYAKQFENMTEDERKVFEENNKNRQKDYERIIERQEEARERMEEARERHEEAQERHREAMKNHEKAQERHKEAMKRHEEMSAKTKVLKELLVKEGLIEANAKSINVQSINEGIKVNGKMVTAEQEAKIRAIFGKNNNDKKWSWIWENDEDED
jgi:hypothetical protein